MEKEGTGGGENGEGRGEKVEGGCCEGGGDVMERDVF